MQRNMICTLVAIASASATGLAQSNINPDDKWAWGENVGWINWQHDAEDPNGISAGVIIADTYLAGFIWTGNVGWINLGDGSPADGFHYANLDDTDFGVNLFPATGRLTGYAWGENVGWINFGGGTFADPPNIPRLVENGCRLRGFVWGENVGWINLDDDEAFVGVLIHGDLDYDRDVDLADLAQLLANYGTTSGATYEDGDIDGDGDVDLADLAALLANYGRTCP